MHFKSPLTSSPPIAGKLLPEKQVVYRTGISVSTLQKHRHKGIGIPYCKIGSSVRYPDSCVANFIEKHLIRVERAV